MSVVCGRSQECHADSEAVPGPTGAAADTQQTAAVLDDSAHDTCHSKCEFLMQDRGITTEKSPPSGLCYYTVVTNIDTFSWLWYG